MTKPNWAAFDRDYPNATPRQIDKYAWKYDADRLRAARGKVAVNKMRATFIALLAPIVDRLAKAMTRG